MSSRAARPRPRRRLVGVSAVAMGALLTTYAGALRSVTYARAVTPAAASCSPGATQVADDTALQAAVANSVDDSVICVTADITVSRTLVLDDTTLTLEGASPATQLSGGGATRILLADFREVADDTLTLRNLTFTQGTSLNADDSDGGAIAVFGNSRRDTFLGEDITIKNSYSFEDGGGIAFSSMNSIRFTRSKFYDNSAASDSGAVEINFANRVVVEESVFQRNSAIGEDGGAISLQDSLDVRITDNTVFQENEAANDGGSIELFGGSNYLLVQDTTFADDSTGDEGGSLFAQDVAEVRLANIAVSGAFAGDNGGAIYLLDDSVVYITNSTFLSNESVDDGGAIHVYGSDDTVALTAITFEGNVTSASGGGLYLSELSGAVQLSNITAKDNSAGSSGGFLRTRDITSLVVIDGLVAERNTANSDGGSIKQTAGSLSVSNSTFLDDSAGVDGGSIYAHVEGPLSITATTATGTRTGDDGGFAYLRSDDTSVIDADFTLSDIQVVGASAADSSGADGGGFSVGYAKSLYLSNVSVTGSSAADDGGGMLVRRVAMVHLKESTFEGNSAGDESGGVDITNVYSDLIVDACTFSGNSAVDFAGGLYVRFAADTQASITNSTFTGNAVSPSGSHGGGGLYLFGAVGTSPTVDMNFISVIGNSAKEGGGIQAGGTVAARIENSIVAGNSASGSGSDLLVSGSATLDDSFSLFTSVNTASGATIDGPGSIFGAPKLNGLADNGGPTLTRLPQWDSPAFQAGDPNWTPLPANDQRGTGFPRDAGGRVSMGAIQGRSAQPIDPVFPPSAPREVTAIAADEQAVVTWTAPASTGSFPVTTYQVADSTGNISVIVRTAPGEPLSTVIEGLVNGQEYSFGVRALNGAGWGAWSDYSEPVVPRPAEGIVITGAREDRFVRVAGQAPGLAGVSLVPRLRFPGPKPYADSRARPTADAQGEFTWQRRTNKKTYVYFITEDGSLRSDRVIIRPRR